MDLNKTYIIAEMSANHAGSLRRAKEIIHAARESGADCIKIQTYTADTLTMDCSNEYFQISAGTWEGDTLYQLYQKASTPWEWQAELKAEAEKAGIDFLSTPFDCTAVDFLESLNVAAYKIASFELVDLPLIAYTASKRKPIILSTGMGTLEEINEAVTTIRKYHNRIALLKCSSAYPAISDEMNLKTMLDLKERFGCPVGLSDHSMGSLGAVTAVAMGAAVVEKHFCLDRSIENPDASFSMEPHEFAQMVRDIRTVEKAKGTVSYGPTKQEMDNISFRKSIFVVRDMEKGDALSEDNIRIIRPGYGMKPKYYHDILGKTVRQRIKAGTPLDWEMIGAPTLYTSRLALREICEDDTDFIVACRSDPDVYGFFSHPHPLVPSEHRRWLLNSYYKDKNRFDWIALWQGQPAGIFGIKKENDDSEEAEASYLLTPESQGKGLAREAVTAMLEFALCQWNCKTALATIHRDNYPSISFIERLGFEPCGKQGLFYQYRKKL